MKNESRTKGRFREPIEGVIEARRTFLKGAAAVGGAGAVLAAGDKLGFPYVGTAKAAGTTWKVGLLKKSGGCGSLLRYVVFDLRKLRDVGVEEPGSVGIVRRGLA